MPLVASVFCDDDVDPAVEIQVRGVEFCSDQIAALVAKSRPLYADFSFEDDAPIGAMVDDVEHDLDERSRGRCFCRGDETRVMKLGLNEPMVSACQLAEKLRALVMRGCRTEAIENEIFDTVI